MILHGKDGQFYIDWCGKQFLYRLNHATLKNELLARAIGISPKDHPKIIDATAGLGRDSMILAALGYEVTMLEKSPVLYHMLQDAFHHASTNETLVPLIQKLRLIQTDASLWLKQIDPADRPDVIYMDPMFPERKKSAFVRKEMVFLQNLLGKDDNVLDLLQSALACAKKRVVIKRPRLAQEISINKGPHFSITGKSSRFDIYLV